MEFAKLHFNFSKKKSTAVSYCVYTSSYNYRVRWFLLSQQYDIIYNKNFENVFCMEWSFFKCKTFITILKLTLGFKVFSHCQFFLDRKILLLPFVPLKNFFCFIYHHNSFWTCESLTSRTKHVLPSTTNVKIYKINCESISAISKYHQFQRWRVYSRQSSILSSCLSRHALFDFVMEGSTEVVVQTEVNTVSNLKVGWVLHF